MTQYTDIDGHTHDAGEEVQRIQAERTGTDVGNWTFDPPEQAQEYTPQQEGYAEGELAGYDPSLEALADEPAAYDPLEDELDSYGEFGQEGWVDFPEPDPHEDLRQVIREELNPQQPEFPEHDAWLAEKQHDRNAQALAAQQAAEQEGLEQLRGMVDPHGKLSGDPYWEARHFYGVGSQMHGVAEEVGAHLLNQGHDPAAVHEWLEAAMPQIAELGNERYRDQASIEDMRAQFRQHYGRT
jgi:hypothetical protein